MGVGYSGAPEGRNNPAMQDVPFIGPIPEGWYTIKPPTNSTHCGFEAMPLIPDPSNEMYGRDDFYMHGDSVTHPGDGSDGCIVQERPVRDQVAGAVSIGDDRLQVVP